MVTLQSRAQELSFYFHIPFCKHKCPYCHFYVTADKEPFKEQLLHALELEWLRLQRTLDSVYTSHKLVSIYFGGGTPTLFEPHRLEKVLQLIEARYPLGSGIEISIETNPEDRADYKALSDIGFNRMSLGVQSLHEHELGILDRRHHPEQAIETVHAIKNAGFENITIDLMYELPKQTLDSWGKTLEVARKLPITHLSLYNLTIEPHTAFKRQEKALRSIMPDDETSAEMYHLAQKMLSETGFAQYEISAFCRDGLKSIHNSGYWTGRHFFGLGPSAFSFDGMRRFQNVSNLSRYALLLERGESPIDFVDEVDALNRKRELLAVNLRLLEGVDLKQFEPLEEETLKALKKLEELGLIAQQSSRCRLTARGILFYDTVASELI